MNKLCKIRKMFGKKTPNIDDIKLCNDLFYSETCVIVSAETCVLDFMQASWAKIDVDNVAGLDINLFCE